MTKIQFDNLIDTCIVLLKSKSLAKISDQQHIDIMMCLNTIFMVHNKDKFEPRFKDGRYADLQAASEKANYTKNITKVYPKWIPNRGMGFYFTKLNIELYGTPHLYSLIDVTN